MREMSHNQTSSYLSVLEVLEVKTTSILPPAALAKHVYDSSSIPRKEISIIIAVRPTLMQPPPPSLSFWVVNAA